jgi:hypothetical protein
VGNLRRIGCPEPTIRDILAGELNEIYSLKLEELATAEARTPGVAGTRDSAAFRQHLEHEKERMLAGLLSPAGSGNTPANTSGASTTSGAPPPAAVESHVPDIPAAFLVGNAPGQTAGSAQELSTAVTDPNLDAETAAQLTRMRNDFAAAVQSGGDQGARNSMEYYRRWLKARRDSDEFFSSMYGGDSLIRAQQQAFGEVPQPSVR